MRLKIGKKLKTASHNSKFTDSYKKRVYMRIILLSNVDSSHYNLHILLSSRQQTHQLRKIGKICLLMMCELKCKWPVIQTKGKTEL